MIVLRLKAMANLIETVGMPLLFVLIWSTGFIVAKFGLPYAPPLTFLLLRYVGVLLLLIPALIIVRAPWPHGSMRHIAVAGVLVQAGYLSGVWCAIKLGMPAGLSALIVGLQPLLTALSAGLIGEPVRRHQWIGLLLGLAGVALVLFNKLSFAGVTLETVSLCLMGLLSITAGTLYQKRFCARFDLRAGATIQFAASLAITLPFAWWLEGLTFAFDTVQWTPRFIGALLWSILALSIGAMFLLYALIRKSAATHVSSLMYLTPPMTALLAWLLFAESFTMIGVAGMLLAVTGVAFVVKK